MEYIIIATITDADGNTTTTQTTTTATDAKQAHDHATTTDGAQIRVYPSTTTAAGIARGAVMIARRTAVNAVMRTGGNETQNCIERETAAINARIRGAETAERILSVVNDYSQDTREFFSTAAAALSCAAAQGMEIVDQYRAAYSELNAAIHAQRAATEYEISTEFLTDGGGDLVSINTAIASIMRGGDKWTPTDGGNMDAATAARLGAAIADAMRLLSPTQRRIAELLGRGYSQRRIAEMTGRAVSTVAQNIAILRGKIAGYISGAAAEFAYMMDGHNGGSTVRVDVATAAATAAETAAAAHNGGANNRRTDGGKERKAASDKTTQAERARRYRERKAAERKAAEMNK